MKRELVVLFSTVLALCLLVSLSQSSLASAPTTILVSVAPNGNAGNKVSAHPDISSDGRFVVFESGATNLVAGDTNGVTDVFVRDLAGGVTERVSVSSDGAQGNKKSSEPSISGDGRYVAFTSEATNLLSGSEVAAEWYRGSGIYVYLHDRQTGETSLVSLSSDETPADRRAWIPDISPDGRYVTFSSHSSHLIQPDFNGIKRDVFLRDLVAGTTSYVNLLTNGENPWSGGSFSSTANEAARVAYRSLANNLVSGDTNKQFDIFVWDRLTRVTRRASVSSSGTQATTASDSPVISADGRFVAFETTSRLVMDDSEGRKDVFVHEIETGQTTRVSISDAGNGGNGDSTHASLSGDGRFVVFASLASNLITDDTSSQSDIFLHDRQTGNTTRVSLTQSGTQPTGGASRFPVISDDGTHVAFISSARNLVSSVTLGSTSQIYVRILVPATP